MERFRSCRASKSSGLLPIFFFGRFWRLCCLFVFFFVFSRPPCGLNRPEISRLGPKPPSGPLCPCFCCVSTCSISTLASLGPVYKGYHHRCPWLETTDVVLNLKTLISLPPPPPLPHAPSLLSLSSCHFEVKVAVLNFLSEASWQPKFHLNKFAAIEFGIFSSCPLVSRFLPNIFYRMWNLDQKKNPVTVANLCAALHVMLQKCFYACW